VLMDAFPPGIGNCWGRLADARPVALPLLRRSAAGPGQGHERPYFGHFWNDFAANPKRSPRPIAASMRGPTLNPEPLAPASSTSATSSVTPRASPGWA